MSATNSSVSESRQFATFTVDGMYFGIDVCRVQEVLRYQEMTQVPLAPAVVRGLINLRGQIVTAIEMRERLRLTRRSEQQEPMNVIIHSPDGGVSLLVDEIGDVVETAADQREAVPSTLGEVIRQILDSVYTHEGRLLLVLNAEKTLQTQEYHT